MPAWPEDYLTARCSVIRNGWRWMPIGATAMWGWVPWPLAPS